MTDGKIPSVEEMRKALTYDQETGLLYWKIREFNNKRAASWNGRFAGKLAGKINSNGYRSLGLNGKTYVQHRVVWAMWYGEWPAFDLDHINMCKTDNRIINLRFCTDSQNGINSNIRKNNRSGSKGVYFCNYTGRWRAAIGYKRSKVQLGEFDTAAAAARAYDDAAVRLFGEFARTNGSLRIMQEQPKCLRLA